MRSFACLTGLVALGVMAVLVLVHSLNEPWLKRRLQKLARTSAGVEIDYRSARIVGLSEAEVEGLAVQSPAEVQPFAPHLVRIGRLDARWSLWALFLGRSPIVQRVAASDVTLTVVVDEHGRTSFDGVPSSGSTSAPGPTVPLSGVVSKLLGTAPPVGQVDIDHVSLILVRTEHGDVSDRTELTGLAIHLAASSAEPATRGWGAQARLGSLANPLELGLMRMRRDAETSDASARLWVAVDATSSALAASLDMRMIKQTFAAGVSVDHGLHVEARLRFDPTAGRTDVTLEHTEADDGAATTEASIEIPDAGDPIVHHAHGDIDLARLLQWVPAGLVPVTAGRAQVRYRVDSLVAGPVVRLSEGGAVALDADVSNLVSNTPAGPFQVEGGELWLRAQPARAGGVAVRGAAKLRGARLAPPEDHLAADDLAVDFDGQQGADGALAGRVGVRFAGLARTGPPSLVVRDGRVELRVQALHPAGDEPLSTQGDLSLSIDLTSIDLRSPDARTIVDGLALRAHATLAGHAPYALELEAPLSRLRVIDRNGNAALDAPARIEVRARDVLPDVVHPAASRGVVHAVVDLGDMRAELDATKGNDAMDFALRASSSSLKAIRPLLPPALRDKAPWDRMQVAMRSSGHVERRRGGGDLALRQTTEIDVERPAFEDAGARSLSLIVKSQGTALQHQADVDLRAQGLTFGGGSPSDDHLALSVTLDRTRPSLQFHLTTAGRAAANLSGSLSFDPSRRALPYEIEGRLAGLADLAPFTARVRGLDAFDLSHLEVDLSARGTLLGVVTGVARDGTITLEPNPTRTASVEGTTDLRVAHFRWTKGDTAIVAPTLAWHADLRAAGTRRTLDSRLEVGALHLDLGSRDVDLNGISDDGRVVIVGNLVDPEVELTERLSVRAVEQDVLPAYPLGDLAFSLSAERGPRGVVHVSDMKLGNGSGGTAIAVSGNFDPGDGHRTLAVTTSLTQDLARLSTVPERFKGRGKVTVEANVTSPDLAHYNVRASLKGEDVTVALPRAGVDVETANGEVPITLELEVGESGVALRRSEKRSPYSMLRFADQHPLLSRAGFLSIARVKTPFVSIAPLVGNLEIDQNVVSLRQFEMGVRGGNITGQCGLDWDGARSTLELHVRASGVQSSHGEPFDGNIAVVISAADRTIQGRAEILRIGKRHLLDLLDLEDPLHVDAAMNRVRTALGFGYPDNLRLIFDHGFASAHLELGGLARFVSIGEIRGIPMGPIIDKALAPVLDGPLRKETQ